MRILFIIIPIIILSAFRSMGQPTNDLSVITEDPPLKKFSNITLEMSLKPFKKNDKQYIKEVCRTLFFQWNRLLQHTDTVSVMLWTADGSEILSYTGSLNQPLEWAMYIGNPNTAHEVNSKPETLSLHERAYTYLDNPPAFTYADLKKIVSILKEEGKKITGKPIRIGATFDPGPEFAKSAFKYKKHPEICMSNTMGSKSFVCCYAVLNEDKEKYAAYPDGILQGTPFGSFFGKQSRRFLKDMGFDYLWLSNGFGFGMETWNATGVIFNGKSFHPEKINDTREKIMGFWTLFRQECPDYRIETRGTNMSTGIDLAGDGVDLRSIYCGGFNLLPPPNSPWAAIDGDFGLELTGYMSRMAELPDDRYLFRFYTHDPWWANSPWLDRYGREPHDIYLPMAVSRINAKGEIRLPTHLSFLSVDNSYGNMPDRVPDEVIPHLLQSRRTAPDRPGPLVWIYPFDEYHHWVSRGERLEEVYYGDWFIRQAINDGFPMNTIVSTGNFSALMQQKTDLFNESVLVSIVPEAGSEWERQLTDFVKKGGKAIIYGPAMQAGKAFLDFLNIKTVEAVSGEFTITSLNEFDNVKNGLSSQLTHDRQLSGGGIETIIAKENTEETIVSVKAYQQQEERDIVIVRKDKQWNGGAVCYVRGTNSAAFRGGRLLTTDNPAHRFTGGSLMRYGLDRLGYSIRYNKHSASQRNPVNTVSRHDNGFYFSGYVPDQTVEILFRFPQGIPVFTGMETEIKDGWASYRLPRAWNKECRVFVEQQNGFLKCQEIAPVELNIKRKINISGLKDAVVRVFPGEDEQYFKAMTGNNHHTAKPDTLLSAKDHGTYYEYKNITGQLVFTW